MRRFALALVATALAIGFLAPGAMAQVSPQSATLTVTCSSDPCSAGSTLTVALPGPNSACTFNVTANTGTVQFEQTNNSAATGPWIGLPLQKNDYSGNASSTSGTYYGSQVVLSGIAVRARLSGAGSATVTVYCQQVAISSWSRSAASINFGPSPAPVATPNFKGALVTSGFTHAWTGAAVGPSPAACASSQPVTDQIGAQNLTGINSTSITCGTASIIKDGTSSFFICSDQGTNPCGGGSVHDYFSVPSAALPVSTALTECSAVRDSGGPFNNAGGTLFSYDNADRIIFYLQGSLYGTADVRTNGSQSSVFRMGHDATWICVVSNGTNVITYLDGMPDLLTTNNPSGGPGGAGGWGAQVVSGPTLVCNCYVQWLAIGPPMTNATMLWLYLQTGL